MATPHRPAVETVDLLSGAVALITAAQSLLDQTFCPQDFADEVNDISIDFENAADAVTHMAIACAQVLRAAATGTVDEALAATGLGLAAYAPKRA